MRQQSSEVLKPHVHTRLTVRQRRSLIAHICRGHSYDAISKKMGIPFETVRSFAKRRAAQLRVSGRIGITVQYAADHPQKKPIHTSITERQLEALRHLVTGMTNKEIGSAMAISAETVKDHLETIRKRLRVKSRTALVAITVRSGWAS